MAGFCHLGGPGTDTNFGRLEGGFLHVRIPETGVDAMIFAYADGFAQKIALSHKM